MLPGLDIVHQLCEALDSPHHEPPQKDYNQKTHFYLCLDLLNRSGWDRDAWTQGMEFLHQDRTLSPETYSILTIWGSKRRNV